MTCAGVASGWRRRMLRMCARTRGRCTARTRSRPRMCIGCSEDPAGGILFLEDVDEETYRLDGFLVALARAGRLAAASGIVLGSWHKCGDLAAVRALAEEMLPAFGVPVLWEQGFGHDPDALSIPLNVDGVLRAEDGGIRLS
ncbi:MAG: hypothetical protein B7X41_21960, partial [Microbacterium sp. 14-71-5]